MFPRRVFIRAKTQIDDGVALRFDGVLQQVHVGLRGGAAAFFGVAVDAGADEVVPSGSSTQRAGDDVVKRQLLSGEFLAAVLAERMVAGVNVTAVELHVLARQAIITQQADDARDGDFKADGADKVMRFPFELGFKLGDFHPAVHVIRKISIVFDGDDFGKIADEKRKSPAGGNDADGHVKAVKNQDIRRESGNDGCFCHVHCSNGVDVWTGPDLAAAKAVFAQAKVYTTLLDNLL